MFSSLTSLGVLSANYSTRNGAARSPSADPVLRTLYMTGGAMRIATGLASCAIGAACFLRPINSPCPRRDDGDARDQVGGPFLQRFFCGHARVCGQPAARG